MMQPTEHLDDCPFCGDDARLETEVSANSYQNDAYYVACSSCGATGPCDDDKHKAIDKWNHPKAHWLWVNCDGLPNHAHKTIAVKKGELCPACVAMSERDILMREFRGSLDIEQGLRESRQEIAAELAAVKVENALLKAEPGLSLVLRCGELEADVVRLTERVSELTEQANAAYAPYREKVMAAREEVQRLSALIGMKDDALNSFAEFYDKCAKAAGYEGGVYSEEMDAKILAKIGGE